MKNLLKNTGNYSVYIVFRDVNYIPKRKKLSKPGNDGIRLRKGDLVLIPYASDRVDFGVYSFSHAGHSNFHQGGVREQARMIRALLGEGYLTVTDPTHGKVLIADKKLDFPVFYISKFITEFAKK